LGIAGSCKKQQQQKRDFFMHNRVLKNEMMFSSLTRLFFQKNLDKLQNIEFNSGNLK
jgi:hypothetical protein